jgi:ABC-type antimicrobial peptide transport system permease subunit
LGATAGDVYQLIIGRGLTLAGLGAVIGIVAALALARLTSSLLFGIHPFDPVTFFTVPAVLILVALCASYVPARRAVRVSPLVALKSE